jgi:cardiolipin synthase
MAQLVTVSSEDSVVAFPGKCKETDDLRSMNQLRAVPNLLTFLRLCMVPFLVLAILDGHYRTAFLLFVIAGISDGLDGLLARVLSQHTTLGQYLDPVADKLMLSTLFLVLNHEGLISRRVTVLVFGRDLGILIVGAILFAGVGMRNFKPSFFGKANTFAQVVALVAVLLAQFDAARPVLFIREWALFSTMGLTCLSGFDYSIRIALRLAGSPESAPNA